MPRNITVTLADGSTHVYRGAPDNVTPDQVMARAKKEFGQDVHALDGGKNPARAPVPVTTVRQDRAAAKPDSEGVGGWLLRQGKGLVAGVNDAAYGIPNRLAAIPSHFVTGRSYSDQVKAGNAQLQDASRAAPVASIGANILESVLSGKAEAAGAAKLGTKLASSASPIVAHGGNVLQAITRFKRGQGARNVARAAVVGGVQGGAQAAGHGENIKQGVETGAATGAVFQGGSAAIGKYVLRPAADVLGISGVGSYLRRFTNMTVDEMKAKAAAFRQATGAEPTIAELLPREDRERLISHTVANRPAIVEQVAGDVRARTANMQPEMADTVRSATEPQQRLAQRQMLRDLADANGGKPASGDAAMALKASKSPTDMLGMRREESRRIMAPHDDSFVTENFADLIPQHPQRIDGKIVMQESDPEITTALRSVAGGLPRRPEGDGVTVRDISNMISDLREDAQKGGIEGRAADRAAAHLMDVISTNVPEAAEATAKMRSAYAAHSRMAQGMGEGWQQRLRDEIQVGTSNKQAQDVRNAYDSEEGVSGRQLGQTNRLTSDISNTTPERAVASTIELARSGDPAIGQNIGQNAADQIQGAAQAQAQSAENLGSTLRSAQSGDGATLTPEALATGLLALSPHSFITTKAHFLKSLASATFLPEAKGKALAKMLFSQDPRLIAKATGLLNTSPEGRGLLSTLVASGVGTTAPVGNPADAAPLPPQEPDPTVTAPAAPQEAPPEGTPPDPAGYAAPSGYAVNLQHMYNSEDPAFVDLVERVAGHESGGKQTNPDGTPVTSKKGAIGTMQVMPTTAPEAAKLAGVPWDEKAYKTDPAYNKLIGAAYLGAMLHRYGGSVPHALAAYNAGPGRVDDALAAAQEDGNWVAHLPQETQDYVGALG